MDNTNRHNDRFADGLINEGYIFQEEKSHGVSERSDDEEAEC